MNHLEICEKYKKWIINYKSDEFPSIYFVWITDLSDKNEEDKLLVNQMGKIINAKTKRKLLLKIKEVLSILPDNDRIKNWIFESQELEILDEIVYDLRGLESKIDAKNLSKSDYEALINFINIFEDYEIQMGVKKSEIRSRNGSLKETWYYYYEEIFLPLFYSKDATNIKEFEMNFNDLKLNFQKNRERFEREFE